MTTTATIPGPVPPFDEGHEIEMEETGRSFVRFITDKIRNAGRRTANLALDGWHLLVRGAHASKGGAVGAGRWSWMALKTTGYWSWWAFTGVLQLIGNGTYSVVRFAGIAITYTVMFLVLFVASVLGIIGACLTYATYIAVKLVHFLTLLVCSPWIALHSRDALREDWQIFRTGIKPRNLHIIHPQALAAQTLRERETKDSQRAARGNGRASSSTPRKRTQGSKGGPTPRRQSRRAPRLPKVAPAAAH